MEVSGSELNCNNYYQYVLWPKYFAQRSFDLIKSCHIIYYSSDNWSKLYKIFHYLQKYHIIILLVF